MTKLFDDDDDDNNNNDDDKNDNDGDEKVNDEYHMDKNYNHDDDENNNDDDDDDNLDDDDGPKYVKSKLNLITAWEVKVMACMMIYGNLKMKNGKINDIYITVIPIQVN